MGQIVYLCIVYSLIFAVTIVVLIVRNNKKAHLNPSIFIPLLFSIVLYTLIALSNTCEYSGINFIFESLEDMAEIVFILVFLMFVNNWRRVRSESRFVELFKFTPMPLAEITIDGRIIQVNAIMDIMLNQFFGLSINSRSKVMDLWEIAYPDNKYREKVAAYWDNAIAHSYETGRAISPVENEMACRDGSKRTMIIGANVIGKNCLVSMTDITSRKEAEQSLRESEARFKALHNASFGGIAIHDQGIILECNQRLSEITGYSQNELIWMNSLQLFAKRSRDIIINRFLSGYEKPYETIGRKKNGEEFPIRVEAKSIPYKGGVARSVELRDITEIKQAEKEREELQNQLIQAQKMEAVGRLAGGVAHDFNNMLSVILGFTELTLMKTDENDPSYNDLKEVFNAAKRSSDITRQLLAFARQQTISPKILDINKTIGSMLKMLKRLLGEAVDLTWSPGRSVWPVKIDPSQVDQIMANLCVNARDAIADMGKIIIETGNIRFYSEDSLIQNDIEPGEYVQIVVSDDGKGMPREILENLFEPFFTTKELNKGTGLGLATVYGIVKQNGGFIKVYSEPDIGTAFKIYLRRHDAVKIKSEDEATVLGTDLRGNETILIVEDELSILELTSTMLQNMGYSVLKANTSAEAMEIARHHGSDIHLLITDVVMPEMNGRELADALLSMHPEITHLFMSGYTADVISKHGVLEEGVQFIQKPFSMHEFAKSVRRALAGKEKA